MHGCVDIFVLSHVHNMKICLRVNNESHSSEIHSSKKVLLCMYTGKPGWQRRTMNRQQKKTPSLSQKRRPITAILFDLICMLFTIYKEHCH